MDRDIPPLTYPIMQVQKFREFKKINTRTINPIADKN